MSLIQRFIVIGAIGIVVSLGAAWLSPVTAQTPQHHADEHPGPRVEVQNAWVRANVPGQTATGGFMDLTAKEDLQLVGASADVTKVTEVHEMALVNDVMQMREVAQIALPAGKVVSLRPGGYHIMLLDLPKPLRVGQTVVLSLKLRDAQGISFEQTVKVPVKAVTAMSKH